MTPSRKRPRLTFGPLFVTELPSVAQPHADLGDSSVGAGSPSHSVQALDHHEPAVDGEHLAGDEGRLI
jgi:hypothetical protein